MKRAVPGWDGQVPAAEEQGHDDRGAGNHRRVFAEKKESELHRAVFGVITAGELLLSFRKVEWQPIRLRENGDRENNKRDRHRNCEQPFPWVRPIADKWRDEPPMVDLIPYYAG